jgi:hypothetical protein
MNNPKVFTWLDFVTFGLLSIIPIILTIVTWMSGVSFEAKALMAVVSLAFTAIYAIILIMRQKTISSCVFITEGGWGVRNNSGAKITKEEVEAEIQAVKDLWKKAISWDSGVDSIMNKNWMIVFENGVGTNPCTGGLVNGITLASRFSAFDGQIIIYQMDKLTLQASALKHEIGHLIYFGRFGILDNTMTHKFMAACNLP